MAINPHKTPPGGWKYKQPKTETTLVATDWGTLIKAVRDHRRSNGIDVGEVEEDVSSQLEKLYPSISI